MIFGSIEWARDFQQFQIYDTETFLSAIVGHGVRGPAIWPDAVYCKPFGGSLSGNFAALSPESRERVLSRPLQKLAEKLERRVTESNRRPLRGESPARPGVNPWLVAIVVSMATFMEVLDTSIVNVALPQNIGGNLSATNSEATWILTSYLVSNAVILPASGWLATVLGRKRST